jgi:hypothetical protein
VHRLEDRLDADELQRDVRHRGDDAGDRDEQRHCGRPGPGAYEVGRRDQAVPAGDRPQPDQHDEDHRVDDDRVRHREEAGRTGREQQCRHGDERVGGVEIAADQEPGDPGSELAPAEAPFIDVRHRRWSLPASGQEAYDRDREEDDGRNDDFREVILHDRSPRSFVSW